MNRRTRAEILESLREKERNRALILGTGAGTGLSAVAEEKGGADLIIAYATADTAWRGALHERTLRLRRRERRDRAHGG